MLTLREWMDGNSFVDFDDFPEEAFYDVYLIAKNQDVEIIALRSEITDLKRQLERALR